MSRRRRGLGFNLDLGDLFQDAWDLAKEEAAARMKDAFGADHIGAQNATVSRFAQILDLYNAGQMTALDAENAIRGALSRFATYAGDFGSRGAAGIRDVTTLANQIISDLGRGPSQGGGGLPWSSRSQDWMPVLVVGGALLLFMGGRRRR